MSIERHWIRVSKPSTAIQQVEHSYQAFVLDAGDEQSLGWGTRLIVPRKLKRRPRYKVKPDNYIGNIATKRFDQVVFVAGKTVGGFDAEIENWSQTQTPSLKTPQVVTPIRKKTNQAACDFALHSRCDKSICWGERQILITRKLNSRHEYRANDQHYFNTGKFSANRAEEVALRCCNPVYGVYAGYKAGVFPLRFLDSTETTALLSV
ncbi:hypothetical protein HUJ04_011021 [Dendroctonus ponderosae]|nr:hypothetical protein HUJ04_011021 [Dendroctonus ponderosae]